MRYFETKSLAFYLCTFILGVGFASFLPEVILGREIYYFSAVSFFLSLAAFFYLFEFSAKKLFYSLLLASCFLGLWRYSLAVRNFAEHSLAAYANRKIIFSGQVISEPENQGGQTRFYFGHLIIKQQSAKAVLLVKLQEPVVFGERLTLSCKLIEPGPLEDFRYDRYLRKEGVSGLCQSAQLIERAGFEQRLFVRLKRQLYRQKDYLRQTLLATLPHDEASLLAGVLLGDDYLLPADLKTAYSRSGLTHIIAISGLNMTLIAVFLLWLFVVSGLWRRQATLAAVSALWLYTLAIGAPSSAVRASIMSSLVLLAYAVGRLADARYLLLLASAGMLAYKPFYLRDDVGFQLSVLALFGLIFFAEPLYDWFAKKLPVIPRLISRTLAATLAAQLLTWPILLGSFGQLSLLAPFANVAAIWLVVPLMVSAGLALFFIALGAPAAVLYPAYWFASQLNLLASLFGRASWGVLLADHWPGFLTLGYFCIMLIVINRFKRDKDSTS